MNKTLSRVMEHPKLTAEDKAAFLDGWNRAEVYRIQYQQRALADKIEEERNRPCIYFKRRERRDHE
jgi:hypothetical protein